MSWGTKIIITFTVFMAGMLAMVFFVAGLQMDLVEDNYYEKEIKYQDEIDILNRTNGLESSLDITYDGRIILIGFPEQNTMPTGEIHFYRPSDASKDFKIPISIGNNRMQNIDVLNLANGIWKINVTWFADNKKFYKEESIFIH